MVVDIRPRVHFANSGAATLVIVQKTADLMVADRKISSDRFGRSMLKGGRNRGNLGTRPSSLRALRRGKIGQWRGRAWRWLLAGQR